MHVKMPDNKTREQLLYKQTPVIVCLHPTFSADGQSCILYKTMFLHNSNSVQCNM